MSEGQEVNLTPSIIPHPPCWGSRDFVSTSQSQGYYLHFCDQILMRRLFYFCFTFTECLDAERRHRTRIKLLSNLSEAASQNCHPHSPSQISQQGL